jgi:N-acetylmuramoyl-L-alanine amidase
VIKYSQVPASILVEVCNLNNKSDAANLRDPAFRERVARAYVAALRSFYGEERVPRAYKASAEGPGARTD